MLRIQSTVYPPCRIENKIKKGGLWYSAQQNDLLETSKRIINRKKVKTPKQRLIKKLIIVAIILDIIALIQIVS